MISTSVCISRTRDQRRWETVCTSSWFLGSLRQARVKIVKTIYKSKEAWSSCWTCPWSGWILGITRRNRENIKSNAQECKSFQFNCGEGEEAETGWSQLLVVRCLQTLLQWRSMSALSILISSCCWRRYASWKSCPWEWLLCKECPVSMVDWTYHSPSPSSQWSLLGPGQTHSFSQVRGSQCLSASWGRFPCQTNPRGLGVLTLSQKSMTFHYCWWSSPQPSCATLRFKFQSLKLPVVIRIQSGRTPSGRANVVPRIKTQAPTTRLPPWRGCSLHSSSAQLLCNLSRKLAVYRLQYTWMDLPNGLTGHIISSRTLVRGLTGQDWSACWSSSWKYFN